MSNHKNDDHCEDEINHDCSACHGTGESWYGSRYCRICHGTGEHESPGERDDRLADLAEYRANQMDMEF